MFDCYTFFPNLILFVRSEVLSVMRVWPKSVHEAEWEWDWFFNSEMETFGHLFNREHGRIATRDALTEDWPMCEHTHDNLRSGLLGETLVASAMESSVRAHYEKLLARVPLTAGEDT